MNEPDAPDCAWRCGRALTPDERVHGTEGGAYYVCSCCGKTTLVDREGVPQRVWPRVEAITPEGHAIW